MNKLLLVLVSGCVCSVAVAQQPAPSAGAPAAPNPGAPAAPKTERFFDTEVSLTGDYAFRSDVDGGGDVAVTRAMLSTTISHAFSSDFRGSLLLSTEMSWYDFQNAPGLIAGTGKPFGQLSETDISPGVWFKINSEWNGLAGLFFRIAGENDADFGDCFTWGGYLAAQYKPNKDFSVTLGVRANDRIEEDWRVLPALALDWNITPTVKAQIVPAVGGIGFRVTSEINDKVSFLVDGEYETREFRLNDEAPLASGVVRDSRVMVGMGVVWKPCDKVQITARGGMVAFQEFRVDNSAGVQQTEVNTDPAPYIYLGGTLTF
jgi:hypothetical protein